MLVQHQHQSRTELKDFTLIFTLFNGLSISVKPSASLQFQHFSDKSLISHPQGIDVMI